MLLNVSNKGQVTIPAEVRRKLGITSDSQVELVLREGEIALRPLKRVSELAGVLRKYARKGGIGRWDTVRRQTEAAIAEEVVDAGSNRRNQAHRDG